MPSYAFTITTTTTPSIEVYGVNVSYNEILNSLGSFFYLIQKLYLQTNTLAQANEPMSYIKYDSNGNKSTVVVYPAIDPYGKQEALVTDLEKEGLVIDGRLIMLINIFASSMIRYTFFTQRGYLSNALPGPSNKSLVKNV